MTPYLIIGTESSPIRKETQEITFQRFEDSKDFGNTFFSFLKKKKKPTIRQLLANNIAFLGIFLILGNIFQVFSILNGFE